MSNMFGLGSERYSGFFSTVDDDVRNLRAEIAAFYSREKVRAKFDNEEKLRFHSRIKQIEGELLFLETMQKMILSTLVNKGVVSADEMDDGIASVKENVMQQLQKAAECFQEGKVQVQTPIDDHELTKIKKSKVQAPTSSIFNFD